VQEEEGEKAKEDKKEAKKSPEAEMGVKNFEELKQYLSKEFQNFQKDPRKRAIFFSLFTISGLLLYSFITDKDTSISFSVRGKGT
jgi:hypothetical protein